MMGKGMGGSKVEGKMGLVLREREDEADEDEEFGLDDDNDGDEDEDEDEEKKKRGKRMAGAGEYKRGTTSNLVYCQADNCGTDLRDAKKYHKRHKVCELHSKAPVVLVSGLQQRFCQQCSRFHGLSEFDDSKRSCRRRLAGHNQRRRKNSSEYYGEGSN